jgi:hypothetical protein
MAVAWRRAGGERSPLEDALQRARAREAVDDSEAAADEVSALEHELRQVRKMRAQLPRADHSDGVVLVGPAELVRELVCGTLRNVVDALSEAVTAQRRGDLAACRGLVDTARAASGWARTFADCQKVEFFNLDGSADPALGHSSDR